MGGFNNIQESGKPVSILDEGVELTDAVNEIDFKGAGVNATNVGDDVDVDISGTAGTVATSEVPSGTINGSNTGFTLANTPSAGTLKLYQNGVRQKAGGEDYTLSGTTITFVNAPLTGTILLADYNF